MTKSTTYRGTGVAIVTPMQDQQIDWNGLKQALKHVVNGGVQYIVGLGSTGEAATIQNDEQRKVLDLIIESAQGRNVVAGNFGSNDTHGVLQKIKSYNWDGISAILSASPHYNKPTQEGIYQHYLHIADACPVPVILYNVPGRTASNMEAETTLRLAEHDNIIGIKEASNNMKQIKEIIQNTDDNFWLTSGDDEMAPEIIKMGGIGVISVIANAYPKLFSQQIEYCLRAQYDQAQEIEQKLAAIHPLLYQEGNPTGVKALMSILEICNRDVRLPLMRGTDDLVEALMAVRV